MQKTHLTWHAFAGAGQGIAKPIHRHCRDGSGTITLVAGLPQCYEEACALRAQMRNHNITTYFLPSEDMLKQGKASKNRKWVARAMGLGK
jgi:hypothetical protein